MHFAPEARAAKLPSPFLTLPEGLKSRISPTNPDGAPSSNRSPWGVLSETADF
jgi:hypothetical protein